MDFTSGAQASIDALLFLVGPVFPLLLGLLALGIVLVQIVQRLFVTAVYEAKVEREEAEFRAWQKAERLKRKEAREAKQRDAWLRARAK